MGPLGQRWARWSSIWGFSPFLALIKAVTVAVHFKDMNVVGETVEQGPGQALGSEHLGPFVEGKIAGQQCGATLVTLTEYLEQKFGPGFGYQPSLCDNAQVRSIQFRDTRNAAIRSCVYTRSSTKASSKGL